MIIGNGLLANRFINYKNNDKFLIFASGVSNSNENRTCQFDREFNLIIYSIATNQDKKFVYFSTTSIYDESMVNKPYIEHKIKVESYIKEKAPQFYIFRISQILGRANNSTLINFIINQIKSGNEFELWSNATRNLIAIDDVYKIIDHILYNSLNLNEVINVANANNIGMIELVKEIQQALNLKAKYTEITKGYPLKPIDISKISIYLSNLGIDFNLANYYVAAISKYWS